MPCRCPALVDIHPAAQGIGQSRRNVRNAPHRATTPTRAGGARTFFHLPSFSIGLVLGTAVVLITGYLPELLAPPAADDHAGASAGAAKRDGREAGVQFEFDQILRESRQQLLDQPAADPAPNATPVDVGATLPSGPIGEPESAAPGEFAETAPPTGATTPITADSTTSTAPVATIEVEERAAPDSPDPAPDTLAASVTQQPTSSAPPPASAADSAADRARYLLQAASFRSRSDADRLRAELLLLDLPASTGEVSIGDDVWYRVTVGPFPDQATSDLARARMRERNLTAIPLHR